MTDYSNVKKPAFFIPFFDYYHNLGLIQYADDNLNDVHLLNPQARHTIQIDNNTTSWSYNIELHTAPLVKNIAGEDGYFYIFILGHNLKERNCKFRLDIRQGDNWNQGGNLEEIVNYPGTGTVPSQNGFSIYRAQWLGADTVEAFRLKATSDNPSAGKLKLGCVSLCGKYNPPTSPDLNLTMSRQFDGVNTFETVGGATLSNALYTRAPAWQTGFPWELSGSDLDNDNARIQESRTLGRKYWDLKFSYLQDSAIMPKTESFGDPTDPNYWLNNEHEGTISNSNTFFSKVLNKVQGSHLPFIFLPNDSDPDYNTDQWTICRFDQESFDISQVANSVYNMKLKIKEVW